MALGFLLLAQPGDAQNFVAVSTQVLPWEQNTSISISSAHAAAGDYDNDGWADLFVSNLPVLLYNQGHGDYAERSQIIPAIPDTRDGFGWGVLLGDYDNDGDLDPFFPHGTVRPVGEQDALFRNDKGRLRLISDEAGLRDELPSHNAIWLDYDRDGFLDLYVGHWIHDVARASEASVANPPLRNQLYRNQGDGTFVDVTIEAGLNLDLRRQMGSGGGMVAADLNDDGWPDLYVGVWKGPNRFFLNNGEGGFVDATSTSIGDTGKAAGVAVGDVDGDGDLDLFQSSGGKLAGSDDELWRSYLLLDAGTTYLDVTATAGLGVLSGLETSNPSLLDLDNDGDLDLLIGFPLIVFMNSGHGVFEDVTATSGLSGEVMQVLDAEGDGFLDVLTREEGAIKTTLWHNQGNDYHWLRVELAGAESNRNGIGARLEVQAGSHAQVQQLLGGTGLGQGELVAHFGLGAQEHVDRLEIRWPSGQVDVLQDIAADQKIRVFEGRQDFHRVVPSTWEQAPPDTLYTGRPMTLDVKTRPALYEPGARVTAVVADLSDIGGVTDVTMRSLGDGLFGLSTTIEATQTGLRWIDVLTDARGSTGPSWIRMSRQVVVLPSEDFAIHRGELASGWEARVGDIDLSATAPQQARPSIGLDVGEPSVRFWSVLLGTEEPVRLFGYESIRFSVLLQDIAFGSTTSSFTLRIGAGRWDLTEFLDLTEESWQQVTLPLDDVTQLSMAEVRVSGNFGGVLFINDLRLATSADGAITAVLESRDEAQIPSSFTLSQNYPNPFNPETTIRFDLPTSGDAELSLFNLSGQRVATLINGFRAAGRYDLRWDGRDDAGSDLASGMYFYRLTSEDQVESRKLMLLR